ncbi:hypothetical protein L1286_03180 [Pseudoalteromonas sp. SMS1]|uniref:hypothetical protein n=1 Tax=Pseudoalteromonas sp. SMS1 TaxID=2908894 RepID=UPI001F34E373|nr:hypothetical protein [Pseudoalteromonas sp. SMS1]MCF2856462.1 hypothetical protein [Pseudoalteromonas sp. SMS1]
MASIQNAVQVMVDKLVADMQGNQPLSAEEQALVSNAITKLTDNSKLEQAVVAVAESHINDAKNSLQQVSQSTGAALQGATDSLVQTSNSLEAKSTKLDKLDTMAPNLERVESLQSRNNAMQVRQLMGVTGIEPASTSANNRRSQAIFAVYDSNGETFAVRPSYTHNNTLESCRLEFLKLNNQGTSKTTTHTSFVYTNVFEQNPSSKIYHYGLSAYLPLASKDNPSSIEYEIVYSSQDSQNTSTNNYGGIFTKSAGFTTITAPKLNLNARDQYGVPTITSHAHNRAAVLYDNQKHCLVLVDSGTSRIIEKYRDGNVISNTAIANAEELQAYVDAGDFTTVNFIFNNVSFTAGANRSNHSVQAMSNEQYNYYGYFGVVNNVVRMGGTSYSAHYRFTTAKRLEPVNFYFQCNQQMYRASDSNGTVNGEGVLTVCLESMDGELLGAYQYESYSDHLGRGAGFMAGAINCINPYSHVGILNESYVYNHHGIGRTCRAF